MCKIYACVCELTNVPGTFFVIGSSGRLRWLEAVRTLKSVCPPAHSGEGPKGHLARDAFPSLGFSGVVSVNKYFPTRVCDSCGAEGRAGGPCCLPSGPRGNTVLTPGLRLPVPEVEMLLLPRIHGARTSNT